MSLNTFQRISEENYIKLQTYIARLRSSGLKLPSRGGKVNKTAVANACGFNRETFNQNSRFDHALNEAVTELGLEDKVTIATLQRETADKSRITVLEQQLASLRGENYELRRQLARYEHSSTTGKRVIP